MSPLRDSLVNKQEGQPSIPLSGFTLHTPSAIMCKMRLGASAAFFVLYLAVQIAVPAIQIVRRDSNFRWGMFAESGERHDIFLEYPGQARESLDQLRARTGRGKLLRSQVDGALLTPYLCSQTPKPARIIVRNLRTGAEEHYPCR